MHARRANPDGAAGPGLPTGDVIATGVPGDFTVGDVANLYSINPLCAAHRGWAVLGIATLASFIPDGAFCYGTWSG